MPRVPHQTCWQTFPNHPVFDFGVPIDALADRLLACTWDQPHQTTLAGPSTSFLLIKLKRILFEEMGLQIGEYAPTEQDPWRGRLLQGEVNDENKFALGGISRHAGLFGTAKAVGQVTQAWFAG